MLRFAQTDKPFRMQHMYGYVVHTSREAEKAPKASCPVCQTETQTCLHIEIVQV